MFDTHVSASDPDSQDWADGAGAEEAAALVAKFTGEDWAALELACRKRPEIWRCCVAQVLTPAIGIRAQQIILNLVHDKSVDVAFEALRKVSFYCGVNARSDGPFIDDSIVHPDFLARARQDNALVSQAATIALQCDVHFARLFRLLASRLERPE